MSEIIKDKLSKYIVIRDGVECIMLETEEISTKYGTLSMEMYVSIDKFMALFGDIMLDTTIAKKLDAILERSMGTESIDLDTYPKKGRGRRGRDDFPDWGAVTKDDVDKAVNEARTRGLTGVQNIPVDQMGYAKYIKKWKAEGIDF